MKFKKAAALIFTGFFATASASDTKAAETKEVKKEETVKETEKPTEKKPKPSDNMTLEEKVSYCVGLQITKQITQYNFSAKYIKQGLNDKLTNQKTLINEPDVQAIFREFGEKLKAKAKDMNTPSKEGELSLIQKVSYSIGLQTAGRSNEFNFSPAMINKAIDTHLSKGTHLIQDDEIPPIFQEFQTKLSAKEIAKGTKFLEENKKKEGVKVTSTGLQYKVITEGKGKKPLLENKVKVHYEGTLISGSKFDSSYDRGEPIEFQVTGVIKGWTEALQLMTIGSKYELYIPSDLAYGPRGSGKIPPNAVLIFTVELIDIL